MTSCKLESMRAAALFTVGLGTLALASAACGSSGVKQAPVLDSSSGPATLSLDTVKNKYPLAITVSFHDADDAVVSLRFELKGYPSQTLSFLDNALTQTVTIDLGAGFKGQTLSYTVQVIDASGLASNPQFGTVQLL